MRSVYSRDLKDVKTAKVAGCIAGRLARVMTLVKSFVPSRECLLATPLRY